MVHQKNETSLTGQQPPGATDRVELPLPPRYQETAEAKMEMEIYARFMRHLRLIHNSRMEIKVLGAIQYVADMMDIQDGQVAKTLVDLGLRAPRMAFPAVYLEYADCASLRSPWDVAAPNKSLRELHEFWGRIGEDRFAAFQRSYPLLSEELFCRI